MHTVHPLSFSPKATDTVILLISHSTHLCFTITLVSGLNQSICHLSGVYKVYINQEDSITLWSYFSVIIILGRNENVVVTGAFDELLVPSKLTVNSLIHVYSKSVTSIFAKLNEITVFREDYSISEEAFFSTEFEVSPKPSEELRELVAEIHWCTRFRLVQQRGN